MEKIVIEEEVIATFDTEETAYQVSSTINEWVTCFLEDGETADLESFEDFGLSPEEFVLERDSESNNEEHITAHTSGNKVFVTLENANHWCDIVQELLEAMGAYEVNISGAE